MIPGSFSVGRRAAGTAGRARLFALLALAVAPLSALPMLATPAPTPTPTPRRHLSGGFGRTPVPGAGGEGQDLADVVRAAAAARRAKESRPVAITNESLVKDPKQGRLSTPNAVAGRTTPSSKASTTTLAAVTARPVLPGLSGVTPTPAAAAAAATPAGSAATASSATAEEAVWRERARSAHRRVEELKAAIPQLESDTKQLENDFYRWDDGQYRDRVIKPAWDKKREELETARQQLVAAESDLADLPEQARKAGALPGWLRE